MIITFFKIQSPWKQNQTFLFIYTCIYCSNRLFTVSESVVILSFNIVLKPIVFTLILFFKKTKLIDKYASFQYVMLIVPIAMSGLFQQ